MLPNGTRINQHGLYSTCFLGWICTKQILHNPSQRQARKELDDLDPDLDPDLSAVWKYFCLMLIAPNKIETPLEFCPKRPPHDEPTNACNACKSMTATSFPVREFLVTGISCWYILYCVLGWEVCRVGWHGCCHGAGFLPPFGG